VKIAKESFVVALLCLSDHKSKNIFTDLPFVHLKIGILWTTAHRQYHKSIPPSPEFLLQFLQCSIENTVSLSTTKLASDKSIKNDRDEFSVVLDRLLLLRVLTYMNLWNFEKLIFAGRQRNCG
jgi:hypothetical protein